MAFSLAVIVAEKISQSFGLGMAKWVSAEIAFCPANGGAFHHT